MTVQSPSSAAFPHPLQPQNASAYYTRNGVKLKVDMDSFQPQAACDDAHRGAVWHDVGSAEFSQLAERFGFLLIEREMQREVDGEMQREVQYVPCFVDEVHGIEMARDLRSIAHPFYAARYAGESEWTVWDQAGFCALRVSYGNICAV